MCLRVLLLYGATVEGCLPSWCFESELSEYTFKVYLHYTYTVVVRSLHILFMGMVLAKYVTTFLGRIDWFPGTDLAFKFSLQIYNGV